METGPPPAGSRQPFLPCGAGFAGAALAAFFPPALAFFRSLPCALLPFAMTVTPWWNCPITRGHATKPIAMGEPPRGSRRRRLPALLFPTPMTARYAARPPRTSGIQQFLQEDDAAIRLLHREGR